MPIQILSDDVASQIAAGEVVERPASVVKELLENSLDAGARSINIRIEGAGQRLIEVSDDGDGISQGELTLAVARHATSKLRTAEDLFHITTLGFRGEALASIASVSRFSITTRRTGAEVGSHIRVEGGAARPVEGAGGPEGTEVRVEDLFFNVPARLKFLKHDSTERGQIDGLVTRYALAYPQVRFQLWQDNRATLKTSGNGDRREILAQLYGIEIARQLLEVNSDEDGRHMNGFISPVALTRSNRRDITFFINGRWVQSVPLTTALVQAYHTLLMVGRFPLAVVFLNLPPEEVDVNVHPAKAEVRFREPERIFSLVQRGTRRALLAYSPVPSIGLPQWQTAAAQPRVIDPAWDMAADLKSDSRPAELPEEALVPSETVGAAPVELPSGQLPLLRLIGQVGLSYLVAEGPDGLYLIDQHAAHERVLFERLMKQVAGKSIPAQALIEPAVVTFPPQQAGLFSHQMDALEHIGFQIEPFGPASFRVRAIPALLVSMDPAAALRVLVEDFEEDENPLRSEIEGRVAARVCKRAAVKAGQAMSIEEQKKLVADLETCQSPRTCPHGRPTMIHLSVDLLERQFGRRGSR
ncbi:DNA mismatch repair protein MutL [Longilinea arvoryzae]|uniref:DNA mismatch repair protein MutL n=1 Tax=Longilinea arvoryzae TaxID=360412 RepID=A0A0S7BKP0_9CHLR|nr:DNA mismatch repair endonuclease MutL [Longilinea arvoryzae]GAP14373.1 DNA mismatch repair protein MutL [Longilinea arvoryzae]